MTSQSHRNCGIRFGSKANKCWSEGAALREKEGDDRQRKEGD